MHSTFNDPFMVVASHLYRHWDDYTDLMVVEEPYSF